MSTKQQVERMVHAACDAVKETLMPKGMVYCAVVAVMMSDGQEKLIESTQAKKGMHEGHAIKYHFNALAAFLEGAGYDAKTVKRVTDLRNEVLDAPTIPRLPPEMGGLSS